MAYAYSGVFSMDYIHSNKNVSDYKELKNDGIIPERVYNNERIAYFIKRFKTDPSTTLHTDEFYCCTVLTDSKIVNSPEIGMTPYTFTSTITYWNGKQEVKTQTSTNRNLGRYNAPNPNDPGRIEMFGSSIPIFDSEDTESINKYVHNGDTSGAIKDPSTKWNLYIDGTKSPLYKLTWNCADVKSSDTSKVKVMFCGMDDAVPNTYIVKESHYYNYNDKSVKLNYHDIREAVWGDMGSVKGPVAIIVQFEFFAATTVVPEATSSYMYCELFPNETNGHMYGKIGFCEVGEHSTWFVKTNNGDSSTFSAHEGTEGSDGYTKDDDKGYDDNKDKDDDDDDTKVLSSGIGVLTSTFHMTKERIVQLGQFLWGSSIFDEFSLINNNPIENIISCKAIPYAISGTTQEITLGNVKTGVNGEKISQNFSKQTIGTVAIAEHYKNFLDYAPYTNVIIYLPYIGFKELDTSLVMGKTLKIEYTLDVITGGCLAQIYVGKIRLYEFTGNIGVDISITASNRAQVESAYISAGVGVVSSAMNGNAIGVADSIIGAATSQYHYSGTGNPSPSCVSSTNRT